MELTDLAIVTKARLGDADAFRVLVERHSRPLFRLAFRMTGNQHDAEDVVQESFLRAYRQLGKFDERASFGTWLYRIATNCSLDVIRSRKRRSKQEAAPESALSEAEDPVLSLPSGDPAPDRLAMSGEVRGRVAEAMNELSASERTAFVLRHFEGMRIEDVGRVLGCQPGAAKHSVFRAVQKLRRTLSERGKMNHLSEEQLILHYYGEEEDALSAERHLGECEACRALYGSLQRTLNVVDSLPVPEPGAEYGERVWKRIEHRLPARRGVRRVWALPAPWRWAAAGAAFAALLVAAFLAGRFYPHTRQPAQLAAADPQAGERILLVAVGDYLERSELVLIELANARSQGPLDISTEQERAVDLVSENRLYRQTAAHTGDAAVASVLDELERVLLDITHAPSRLSAGELERLRQRLEAEGILFKIRVLGSNVRNQEEKGPEGTPEGTPEAAPRAAGQKL